MAEDRMQMEPNPADPVDKKPYGVLATLALVMALIAIVAGTMYWNRPRAHRVVKATHVARVHKAPRPVHRVAAAASTACACACKRPAR